jgi:hypothetical protein
VITVVQELPVVVFITRFTVAPLQASLAVGAVNKGVAVHSIVLLAGTAPIVGAVLSVTVKTWLLVPE